MLYQLMNKDEVVATYLETESYGMAQYDEVTRFGSR